MNVSTSTTADHSNIPHHRIAAGTTAGLDRKLPFESRANRRKYAGSGVEKPSSTLPTVIAHDRNFAPTPIAPDTSCRTHRTSPCPERRGGESGIADVAPACTADATRRVVQRSISAKKPDAHQPEVPSIVGPARRTAARPRDGRGRLRDCQCLFHHPGDDRGTLVRTLRGSAFD